MRNTFAETLYQFAKKDKKISIVVADISPAGSMEKFRLKYPDRFINVGVAEQVMIGIAAGMAMKGMRSFAYTIATFALYRPFEMIRDDVCYQNLPVTIVGMGSGSIYATLGGTHLTQEDISVARSLPNMNILAPCDPIELKECVKYCCTKNNSPMYLRIGKSGEPILTSGALEKFKFGKIRKMINGKDTCIMSYGPILGLAKQIIEENKKKISLYNCHTLKPFDENRVKNIFKKYRKIIILEDHSKIGGLASIVKELAFDYKFKGIIKEFNLKDEFIHSYFNQETLINKHGISKSLLKKEIL